MRVLLSTSIASDFAAHGGPVVARRHAEALARQGVEIRIAAPEVTGATAGVSMQVEVYEPTAWTRSYFGDRRPDDKATTALGRIIDRFHPDVVYDVHGPAWAIEAADAKGLPSVSMIGDYSWFCRRHSLLDSRLQRCSGPETREKCFTCMNQDRPWKPRIVQQLLRHSSELGMPAWWPPVPRLQSHRLWDAVGESHQYTQRMRDRVSRFIVGDRKAHDFFIAHGIAPGRLVRIPQCLPEEALVVRRPPVAREAPGIDRPMRFGFVGRPHPDKGIQVLAKAFESLPENLAVELWIIHAQLATPENIEPVFQDASKFRAQLESGRIKLFQPRTSEALFQLMASVDVGVVPSLVFESPSLVLLEFVAQRTPIVRSESEGMEHVTQDGVNGRTFRAGDWEGLRSVLLEIAGEPQLLERWRTRLPAIGNDADYARQLVELFTKVTAKSASTRPEALHA